MKNKIVLLGHASVRIEGERCVYVDPWKLKGAQPVADIILITHPHFDHFSPNDVTRISDGGTEILCPKECAGDLGAQASAMKPGETKTVKGVEIRAVAAYNIGKKFHPKSAGWMGYVVTMGGESIYVAGDTDAVPEMNELKNITVALLPVGGTYTMSAKEAADVANRIAPALAIPIHFGDIVGSAADGKEFQRLCKVKTQLPD